MRRTAYLFSFVCLVNICPSAIAANQTLENNYAAFINSDREVGIRIMMLSHSAVSFSLNLGTLDINGDSPDSRREDSIEMIGGYRYYLFNDAVNNHDLKSFGDVSLSLFYRRKDFDNHANIKGGKEDTFISQLAISYGGEYFLAENISIEGKAGFSVSYGETETTDSLLVKKRTHSTGLDIPIANIGLNYYW
jgi:hypothetical protein